MIRLFFDEDVPEAVAVGLRLRGYERDSAVFPLAPFRSSFI
jgi:hypothetical protein